jgi:hypothetical protein
MQRVRITPSFTVATLALVVAVGGTATAASYIITKTSQIKPSVRRALKGNRGPRGFTGLVGAPGAQGATGATGATGVASIVTVDGSPAFMCASGGGSCSVASSTATCPAGYRVVGGGFNAEPIFTFVQFARAGATTYGVIAIDDGPNSGNITAQAICVSGPGISASRSTTRSAPSADALGATMTLKLAHLRAQASRSR